VTNVGQQNLLSGQAKVPFVYTPTAKKLCLLEFAVTFLSIFYSVGSFLVVFVARSLSFARYF
jgi:hypothetical protein